MLDRILDEKLNVQRIGAGFGALINSVIHCMMYSHYLWTSFGLNNPFKKMITQAQLIQVPAKTALHAPTMSPRYFVPPK
jgi:hypothetical protein